MQKILRSVQNSLILIKYKYKSCQDFSNNFNIAKCKVINYFFLLKSIFLISFSFLVFIKCFFVNRFIELEFLTEKNYLNVTHFIKFLSSTIESSTFKVGCETSVPLNFKLYFLRKFPNFPVYLPGVCSKEHCTIETLLLETRIQPFLYVNGL